MKTEDIFLPRNSFKFIEEVHKGESPWSAITQIGSIIGGAASGSSEFSNDSVEDFGLIQTVSNAEGIIVETSLLINKTIIIEKEIHVGPQIIIGASTYLEAGAIIKAPCVIGEGCEIRQGAYIRGNVIVGDHCVVGHVTEIKNSIMMDGSAAGHFAYIGDSIMGSHVNLGAGVKLANLQFRTQTEIDDESIKEIVIKSRGAVIATGMSKLGAIIGDYTEIGCNTVTSPGAVIGSQCWISPNTTIPKGFYPPQSFLRSRAGSKIDKSQM